jgi:sugar lactone lactonase YvrE
MAVDESGNVLIADGGQANRIRLIRVDRGTVETVSGSAEGFADSDSVSSLFNTPSGIAVDRRGNLFVADTGNNRIRKIDSDGKVSTVAGSGGQGFKDGSSDQAEFDAPVGVAVDNDGNVFVADTYNDRIRKILPTGEVHTLAGNGVRGLIDGPAGEASFDTPCGIAVDNRGNIFVADTGNDAIRMISEEGDVTTFAGGYQGRRDGWGREAGFDHPTGIAITHDGFLFVTDSGSGKVRRIAPDGEVTTFAGGRTGFADGTGKQARFNGPTGIAVDRLGNIYVADTNNYSIRRLAFIDNESEEDGSENRQFIQPGTRPATRQLRQVPDFTGVLAQKGMFPWPLGPQDSWHEVTGVVGEARGAPGGIALHHLHSGLDIRGLMGDPVFSILNEKVSSPIANWDFDGIGEGVQVGWVSYIHVRIGRDSEGKLLSPEKFRASFDETGAVVRIRARRGARFRVGEFIGTLNRLYHVHLNVGPWNAQDNPLRFGFSGLKDTIAPVIEPDGIEVHTMAGERLTEKQDGRVVVSGDIDIIVSAFDRVDGNAERRKLGLYRAGYQLFHEDGVPLAGFEEPLINIDFSRLPAREDAVFLTYAYGSGVSAYGGATRFKYIVTNLIRDGDSINGYLRTSLLREGNYLIRIIAEDQAGNRAQGPTTELPILITRN